MATAPLGVRRGVALVLPLAEGLVGCVVGWWARRWVVPVLAPRDGTLHNHQLIILIILMGKKKKWWMVDSPFGESKRG